MDGNRMRRITLAAATGAAFMLQATATRAQEDYEIVYEGIPLENAIVDRNLALRLRGEVQLTDDDDELVEEDINYARFPTRLYSCEAKVFQADRKSFGLTYSFWENDQGMDISRWYWDLRVPLPHDQSAHVTFKYRTQEREEFSDRDYYYVGLGKSFENGVYAFLRYRHTVDDDHPYGHQVYGYLSWNPTSRFRAGTQAGLSDNDDADRGPWYVDVFTTLFLRPERTSLRMIVRHYESGRNLEYRDYNVFLYQKLGKRSLLRLSYRYYDDTGDLSAQAGGIKWKHYFSTRFAAHAGYRYYDHSEGANFDTLFAGFSLLL
jgi:hypothetical protein